MQRVEVAVVGPAAARKPADASRDPMLPQLLLRYAFILGISLGTLLISLILDRIFAPLSPLAQFFIQVPVLVLAIDAFRRWILARGAEFELTDTDINASFFFAAPLAALGANSLFRDIGRLIPRAA